MVLNGSGALSGGAVVAEALAQSVAAAQRVLCFVTVDLLRDPELLALAGRARDAGTLVPVLGRPCGLKDEPTFADLHPLPQDGRPLSQQPDREAALVALVSQVLPAAGPRASGARDPSRLTAPPLTAPLTAPPPAPSRARTRGAPRCAEPAPDPPPLDAPRKWLCLLQVSDLHFGTKNRFGGQADAPEVAAVEWGRLARAREVLWGQRQFDELAHVPLDAGDVPPREASFLLASRQHAPRRRRARGDLVLGLPLVLGLMVLLAVERRRSTEYWQRTEELSQAELGLKALRLAQRSGQDRAALAAGIQAVAPGRALETATAPPVSTCRAAGPIWMRGAGSGKALSFSCLPCLAFTFPLWRATIRS